LEEEANMRTAAASLALVASAGMATDHDRLGLPPLVRENLEAFLNGLRARFGDARLFARPTVRKRLDSTA
jgi:hypothetical protein